LERGEQMARLFIALASLVRHDEGQDLIEYSLLVVLIGIAAVVAVGTFGSTINTILWTPIVQNNI
jgi:Flp pilus assembly pilin Flp